MAAKVQAAEEQHVKKMQGLSEMIVYITTKTGNLSEREVTVTIEEVEEDVQEEEMPQQPVIAVETVEAVNQIIGGGLTGVQLKLS